MMGGESMSSLMIERFDMAKKAIPKTTPVRLSDEAIRWARIASGYTGESMAEYVSRLVAEHAKADANRLHAEAASEAKPGRPKAN
jgi:hypothetical protein